jgi:diguanylate cyclase (GGDEF)-like protein
MEKIISKEQLLKLANTDNLTKLNNLFYLKHNFANFIIENKNVFLMMIDFRKLKYINDKYGHDTGDVCLKSFSNLIQEYFKGSILVRKSGDEFIIVGNDKLNTIKSKFNKIKNEIARLYKIEALPIIYGFNVGVTKCDRVDALRDYIKEADAAMYDAKTRNVMFELYDIKHLKKMDYEKNILKNIKEALEKNELGFQYQPTYFNNAKKIHSVEYLLRLNNQPIFNTENYETLKKNYFMEKMDIYAFDMLFDHSENISYFINNKIPININIHVQTINYLNNQHLNLIKQKIKQKNIDAKKVYIDLYMDDDIENIEEIIEKVQSIKDLGFNICLDNVSMDSKNPIVLYILKMPIDIVKISRDTLTKALTDSKTKKILDGVVRMLSDIKIMIVFSKVETSNEYNFIRKNYPNALLQGNYFVKPMDFLDIKAKIK